MSQEKKVHNDYATEKVPLSERRSIFNVAMVAAGFCIAMSGLFAGASLAAGLTLRQSIISALIGNLILSILGGAIGSVGAKMGISSSRLSMYSFGNEGYKVVSFVLALTMAGWFAVQCGLFGNTMNAMFPNAGFITHPKFAGFWGGILMLLTAYFGYQGLSFLSHIAVPGITIVAIIGVVASIKSVGGWESTMAIIPQGSMTIGSGIVLVVGSFAAGATAQADITRYSKTPKAAWIATIFGYLIANTFIIIAGFLTTLTTGIGDLPKAMLALGLGIPALLILVLAQWTTNDNNLYTSSLGMANIFNIGKPKLVLIIGIIGSIIGGLGIAEYFTGWLNILGIAVPPMAGVIIADYYFIRKRDYNFDSEKEIPSWNKNAIISWVIGFIFGFVVNVGIASINAILVAMLAYMILMKVNPIRIQLEERKE